tara:strand:+ start:42 stop:755 length:714 start_codon:yes stop_codon:yes gene_type:complete
MNHLELFSGTHSFGKVSKKLGYNVISLDRDLDAECPLNSGYVSNHHIKEDIMTWDYKKYDQNFFKIITASPVCLWWSSLRNTWIGRKLKAHGNNIITREIIQEDINKYGKPMVDKIFEIMEYFKPKYWIIENPKSSKMKYYIEEKYKKYNTYNDLSYCHFSDWGYKKNTRFWNNIEGLKNKECHKDCKNIIEINKHKRHKTDVSTDIGGGSNRLERYRIPPKLIEELFKHTKDLENL